jgi:hypothetical protein
MRFRADMLAERGKAERSEMHLREAAESYEQAVELLERVRAGAEKVGVGVVVVVRLVCVSVCVLVDLSCLDGGGVGGGAVPFVGWRGVYSLVG